MLAIQNDGFHDFKILNKWTLQLKT